MIKFKEAEALNKVAEFHRTFGHPIQELPKIPTEDRTKLRVDLLQEELNELKQAIADDDIVEIADALCDLQYVLSGAILEFGLADKFEQLFNEVQRSNMSKACSNQSEVTATQANYLAKGITTYSRQVGDKLIIYRSEDHKVLKNKFYSEACLAPIIEQR